MHESTTPRIIAEALERFENNPNSYNSKPNVKELLMERKNYAVKEQNLIQSLKNMQDEYMTQLSLTTTKAAKLKGTIEYLENKLLQLLKT